MSNDTSSSGQRFSETLPVERFPLPDPPIGDRMSDELRHLMRIPRRVFDKELPDGAFRLYVYLLIMFSKGLPISRIELADVLGVSTRTIYTRELQLVDANLLMLVPKYEGNLRVGTEYFPLDGEDL